MGPHFTICPIYCRWGQASLFDLHDLLDDTLADELYFSIRGKMARVLCSISEVEEVADRIERELMPQFQSDNRGTNLILLTIQ